jgi:predicted nucleic-acid-binding Zn-ribbon protein
MNMLIKLHEKKKKVLQDTAKNKFCIVLFKTAKYAEYFYQRTHTTLC